MSGQHWQQVDRTKLRRYYPSFVSLPLSNQNPMLPDLAAHIQQTALSNTHEPDWVADGPDIL